MAESMIQWRDPEVDMPDGNARVVFIAGRSVHAGHVFGGDFSTDRSSASFDKTEVTWWAPADELIPEGTS